MRAARAVSLVHMGELSATRQALEGAPVAPGTHATLRTLTDPECRPPLPREPLNPEVAHTQPAVAFQLDTDLFLVNLRKSRRGAAPGPSGSTQNKVHLTAFDVFCISLLCFLFSIPETFLCLLFHPHRSSSPSPNGSLPASFLYSEHPQKPQFCIVTRRNGHHFPILTKFQPPILLFSPFPLSSPFSTCCSVSPCTTSTNSNTCLCFFFPCLLPSHLLLLTTIPPSESFLLLPSFRLLVLATCAPQSHLH